MSAAHFFRTHFRRHDSAGDYKAIPGARKAMYLQLVLALVLPTVASLAWAQVDPAGYSEQREFTATIRRGPYGVAHINGDSYGDIGYGEGYAAAEDHVCNIAFGLMQARGESAKFLGAGEQNQHIALDAVLRGLDMRAQAREAMASQDPEIKDWLAGYSAGYNRYVREHSGSRNSSWCSGAAWVAEATPMDFMTRMVMMAQTLPRMSAALAGAAPPAEESAASFATDKALQLAALDEAALAGMGSNGWALGSDYSENGRGMLLANPHYPWYGGSRFWEKHLTIPGKLDLYGAQLLGSPGVSIGFNEHLGWTHTVSASQRLVMYRLELDPDNPMRYRIGDDWQTIEARTVAIPVAQADGTIGEHSHTLYFSEYGPLLTMPGMSWDAKYAYTVRDANVGNHSLLAQWKAMGEASDLDEFIDAHRRYNAMPWVNTIATSADGRALYLDNSTVGYLSEAAENRWRASLASDPLAAQLYETRRMVLLNGSDPVNRWLEDSSSPIPGTTPFSKRPRVERRDYVFNSNDSYWLSSPRQPTTDYSVLYGPTETARSLRTRMNIRLLENHYGDAGDDGRFSIREIQQALFANRGLTAELLLPQLLELCGAESELQEACEVLRRYDASLNLDSPGAVLFREWITRYSYPETFAAGRLFHEDFAARDPVETPRGLGDPTVARQALVDAIAVLKAADIALDATLRDTQFAWRGGDAIPVHGGNSYEGVANLQLSDNPSASPIAGVSPASIGDSRYLTDAGYPIVHGSSFIYTLGFDEDGPFADALLSYSQSGNPNAKHFKDQTALYAEKRWRRVAFKAADVERTTVSIRNLRSSDLR